MSTNNQILENRNATQAFPLRGDIYWANLEPVEGSEQGGSRPVLIISNNIMNRTANIVIIIPMTRADEKPKNLPINVDYDENTYVTDPQAIQELKKQGHNFAIQKGVILCNQARAISKKRLLRKVGFFKDYGILKKVELAIIDAFALEACEKCGIPLRPKGISCPVCGSIYRHKCVGCGLVFDVQYNYCPRCGKAV